MEVDTDNNESGRINLDQIKRNLSENCLLLDSNKKKGSLKHKTPPKKKGL